MLTIPEALAAAVAHQTAGRLAEAEGIYWKILEIDPDNADARQLLGTLAHAVGKNDVAVDFIGQAIALNGNVADYHWNRGIVLAARRRAAGRARPSLQVGTTHRPLETFWGNQSLGQGISRFPFKNVITHAYWSEGGT